MTVKAEDLRYDLGHADSTAAGLTASTACAVRGETEGDIARIGPNDTFRATRPGPVSS